MLAAGSISPLFVIVPTIVFLVVLFGFLAVSALPRRDEDMRAIEEWAEDEGYQVLEVADPGFFDGLRHPLKSRFENAYLVSLRDKSGQECRARALIGHRLMAPLVPRIRVQWKK